jgi:hypothetical protein
MNSMLRYSPGQKTPHFNTVFRYYNQDVLQHAEQCNGSGDCRKTKLSGGTMCPSFMATKNEKDTTRARANILRAPIVTGQLQASGRVINADERVVQAHRHHERFQLMVAVRSFPEDFQEEVQLRGSKDSNGSSLTSAQHLVSHPVNLPDPKTRNTIRTTGPNVLNGRDDRSAAPAVPARGHSREQPRHFRAKAV